MIRLAVHGAGGRMGRRVCALAAEDERFTLTGVAEAGADAIIDFTSDEGTRSCVRLARRNAAALLVGTTGLSSQTLAVLDDLASSSPVLVAPNTSRGVAVLNRLVADAARLLGDAYEIDVIEQHHCRKRDAPSGTALRLARTLAEQGRVIPADRIHSVRAGDIVGEHTVQFAGRAERIALTHAAVDRDVFAAGALDAVAWLASQSPGLYTMEDALGLKPVRASGGGSAASRA